MSSNSITHKVQLAARNFLRNEGLSFVADVRESIRSGIVGADVSLPLIVCQCARATAEATNEGNWSCSLRIEVRTNADGEDGEGGEDLQQSHHDRAGEVFGKFMTATAKTDLSDALQDFTAQFVIAEEQGWDLNDRSWVSFLVLRVECCGSDFSVA